MLLPHTGSFPFGVRGVVGGSVLLYGSEPSAQIATKGSRTLFPHYSWALTYCQLVIRCNSHIGKAVVSSYYFSAVAPQTVDELRKLVGMLGEANDDASGAFFFCQLSVDRLLTLYAEHGSR